MVGQAHCPHLARHHDRTHGGPDGLKSLNHCRGELWVRIAGLYSFAYFALHSTTICEVVVWSPYLMFENTQFEAKQCLPPHSILMPQS